APRQMARTKVSKDWPAEAPAAGRDGKRWLRGRIPSPTFLTLRAAALGRGADSKAAIQSAITRRPARPTARRITPTCLHRVGDESNRGRRAGVSQWPWRWR